MDDIAIEGVGGGETSVSPWVWIGLSFTATISFYLQATVTEERFVPALNVIANHFNIPDDVAGATLMAAGASSPELFSSIVALFITHSALGLGTVVGSEIFNQLIICAGAVLAARNNCLHLDKAILIREVGFYALSVLLLYLALSDHRPDPDDPDGPEHIYVSFYDALLLFGVYIIYVLVCSYFDNVVSFLTTGKLQGIASKADSYGTFSRASQANISLPEKMSYMMETKHEPEENFVEKSTNEDGREKQVLRMTISGGAKESSRTSSRFAESIRSFVGKFSDGASTRAFQFLVHEEKPSEQHDLHDFEFDEFAEVFSCFLWQRSVFYNKSRIATNGWHLRWFTFTHDKIASVPDRKQYEKHNLTYPHFEHIEVDSSRLLIKLVTSDPKKRNYVLMAPSKNIFLRVVSKCEELLIFWENENSEEAVDLSSHDADDEPSLIEFPSGESVFTIIIYLILLPFNLLLHLTVPDVRHVSAEGDPRSNVVTVAFLAVVMCLLWLIVGSYAMVSSLEHLADLMEIPDAVVGITVSAVVGLLCC